VRLSCLHRGFGAMLLIEKSRVFIDLAENNIFCHAEKDAIMMESELCPQ